MLEQILIFTAHIYNFFASIMLYFVQNRHCKIGNCLMGEVAFFCSLDMYLAWSRANKQVAFECLTAGL